MGAYMLIAFILGFWCIWSANRDVNSLMEALGITFLAIVIKSVMEWSGVPNFDTVMLATWGILFVFTVVVLEAVERFSHSMAYNMSIAIGGAIGWFFLAQWAFSKAGIEKISGWVS